MQESAGSFHHVGLKIQTMLSSLVAPLKKTSKFLYFLLLLHICKYAVAQCLWAWTSWCTCGGQRTTLLTWFFPTVGSES